MIAMEVIDEMVRNVDILIMIIIGPNFCNVDIIITFDHLMLFNT